MSNLSRRVGKLETHGEGGTALVYVPLGGDPDEATAKYLAQHPGKIPSKIILYLSNQPEPDPLPAEFAEGE